MKMRRFWLVLLMVGFILIGFDVLAQAKAGETSISQAKVVYCGMKGLIEGNLGLVVGLIMAFLGVWGLINGGKLMTGIVFIVAGASLTAIPGMVESTLNGFGYLLKEAKFSSGDANDTVYFGMCANNGNDPQTPQQVQQFNAGYTEKCTGGYLDCL